MEEFLGLPQRVLRGIELAHRTGVRGGAGMAGTFAMNDDEVNLLSGRLYDASWTLDKLDMPTDPESGPMGSLGLSNSTESWE